MCEITFKKSVLGESYFVRLEGDLPKNISITKLLGGKEIVQTSRSWSHRGMGGWSVHYRIPAEHIEKAKQSVNSFGVNYIMLEEGN